MKMIKYIQRHRCLPDGCYKLVTYDTYGDGWNANGSFSVSNQFGNMLVPNTVMSPTVGFDPDGQAWNSVPQELSTYFSIGDEPACETFGCTDPLASNYDSDATVDDGSCITCEENSVDVTFSFNQETNTDDELYVYNQTSGDTVFSVEPGELGAYDGKDSLMCVLLDVMLFQWVLLQLLDGLMVLNYKSLMI